MVIIAAIALAMWFVLGFTGIETWLRVALVIVVAVASDTVGNKKKTGRNK